MNTLFLIALGIVIFTLSAVALLILFAPDIDELPVVREQMHWGHW